MKKLWSLLMLPPLALFGLWLWMFMAPTVAAPLQVDVRAQAVDLVEDNPKLRRVGALHYMGGLVLTSTDRHFGGLSALLWLGDGQMLALSDRGHLLRWHIQMRGTRPARLGPVALYPLRNHQGVSAEEEKRDSESLVVDGDTLWVATEHDNRIYSYALRDLGAPAMEEAAPPAMAHWENNGGPETMAHLPDGRLLVISEDPPSGMNASAGLVFAPPQWDRPALRFTYHPPEGFRPTDAVVVDATWMLVLHRQASLLHGVRADIGLVRIADILAGGDVRAQSIARLERPMTVDNMEGLALERSGGRFYLWLTSDDNFNPLQRTLLLRFLWDGPPR